jgi:hypothetical protein
VSVGTKGDHTAVGTEDRADIMGGVRSDRPRGAADRFHGPDVAEVAEGDEFAIRGNIRRSAEANGFLGIGSAEEQGEYQDRQGQPRDA